MAEQETQTAEVSVDTLDFAQFEDWRDTGELPEAEEPPSEDAETDEEPRPESDPDSDPEETEEPAEDEDEEPQPKKKGGYQRKIDKLTRDRYERDARIAELERQLAERKPAEQPQAKAAEADPDQDPEPKEENFETFEQYQRALVRWDAKQEAKQLIAAEREAMRKAETARQAREQAQAQAQAWGERLDGARTKHADFDDVVGAAEIPITAAIRDAILDSELGTELLYALAKRPAEVRRIAALSPLAQVRELGKLEARLTAGQAPNPKPKPTQAPAPITPVGRGAKTAAADPHDDALAGDYTAWLAAREGRSNRRK